MATDCTCRTLENGVHEFHLLTASIEAIDCWLEQMAAIINEEGILGNVLIILPENFLPPVRYGLREIRLWMQRYPQTFQSTRTAVVFPYGKGYRTILRTFQMTLTRGRPTPAEYFFADEYEQAMEWLLNFEQHEQPATVN